MIVERVQRLIDTMGVYQQKLIDHGATLKDMQTLVQKMTSQSESLSATSNTVEGQEGLKTIVNQSLTLASMEIAKFNSGYYNDG
jgi:DNA anti-recombination protein RmuC